MSDDKTPPNVHSKTDKSESRPSGETIDLSQDQDARPSTPADLEATVGHVPQANTDAANAPNEAGLRYQVLRPHARGGLGEVFVAADSELNREVALKEIQKHHAHDQVSRARFVLEAEVTGSLEHPGIVPVYGLGRHDDGRPYYAMRFIRGDSLKEAVDRFYSTTRSADDSPGTKDGASDVTQTGAAPAAGASPSRDIPAEDAARSIEFRKLLGSFIDVCDAIQYAHSRGVLHRDLKPHNIMLGKFGETLVVDWGLARVEGLDDKPGETNEPTLQPSSASGTAPTQYGKAMGTPAFMPPEQAAGRLDELGPKADVYSLGATLYYVLTGQAAFGQDDLGSTLSKVKAGNFPLPDRINPSAPKPLQAICLKAMQTSPDDRYESPRELADDIERYLADEPVLAYREPFNLRMRRWVRKHPKSVSGLAATVLVGLISTIVISAVVAGKNQQLAAANTSLIVANQAERNAKQKAETNRRIAELAEANAQSARLVAVAKRKEAEEAERREARSRKQAESVAEYLMRVFRRADPNVDGRTITMAEVLAESAKDLKGRFDDDPKTKAALLDAIGRSYRGLGLYEDAIPLLEQARDLRIADLGPEHPDTFATRNHLAEAYQSTWDVDKSLPLLEELHRQVSKKLGRDHAHTMAAVNNLGVAYAQAGKLQQAFPLLEDTYQRRKAKFGEEHADTISSMSSLAFAYTQLGDYRKAVPLFEKRLMWLRKEKGGEHPSLLTAMQNLALAYQGCGDSGKALPLLEETLESSTRLLGENHINTLHAKNSLAKALRDLGRISEALPLYEDSLRRRRETLGDDHPHTLVTILDLALAHQANGDLELAVPLLEEAVQGHEGKFGENHVWSIGARNFLAVAYLRASQFERAVPLCEITWQRCQEHLPKDHAESDKAINFLAIAYQSNNELEKSLPLFQKMLAEARAKLGDEHVNTLSSIWNLSMTYMKADRVDAAVPLLTEFIDGRRALSAADPDRFGGELISVSDALLQKQRYVGAEAYLRECLALENSADSNSLRPWICRSMLGAALAGQEKFAEAAPLLLASHEALAKAGDAEQEDVRMEHLHATLKRLVDMFQAQDDAESAKKWQAELERQTAANP